MFHPARLNSAMVASCKLPLGIPSRNLSAMAHLRADRDWLREAAHRAFVAHQAVAFHLYTEQQCIVVAISRGRKHAQPIAAGLALHPKLLARAAPEGHKPGVECLRVTRRV